MKVYSKSRSLAAVATSEEEFSAQPHLMDEVVIIEGGPVAGSSIAIILGGIALTMISVLFPSSLSLLYTSVGIS